MKSTLRIAILTKTRITVFIGKFIDALSKQGCQMFLFNYSKKRVNDTEATIVSSFSKTKFQKIYDYIKFI